MILFHNLFWFYSIGKQPKVHPQMCFFKKKKKGILTKLSEPLAFTRLL